MCVRRRNHVWSIGPTNCPSAQLKSVVNINCDPQTTCVRFILQRSTVRPQMQIYIYKSFLRLSSRPLFLLSFFVCLCVVIKPENFYFASRPGIVIFSALLNLRHLCVVRSLKYVYTYDINYILMHVCPLPFFVLLHCLCIFPPSAHFSNELM